MTIACLTRSVMVSFALFALFTAGCSRVKDAADRAKRTNELKQIGLAYHQYLDVNGGKAPASADDLARAVASDPQATQAVQMVRSGKYVLLWGSTIGEMQKTPSGSSGTILGYEKDVPSAGGLVLMGDASVKNMTAAEFQSAPKAKGK